MGDWVELWKIMVEGTNPCLRLVVFSSYEVSERAPYLGETRSWTGEPTWKAFDRISVEALVGGKV